METAMETKMAVMEHQITKMDEKLDSILAELKEMRELQVTNRVDLEKNKLSIENLRSDFDKNNAKMTKAVGIFSTLIASLISGLFEVFFRR